MAFILKLKYQDEIRRIVLQEGEPTYESIAKEIHTAWPGIGHVVAKYTDEENDLCVLCAQSFSDFLNLADSNAKSKVLRLELVKPPGKPDSMPEPSAPPMEDEPDSKPEAATSIPQALAPPADEPEASAVGNRVATSPDEAIAWQMPASFPEPWDGQALAWQEAWKHHLSAWHQHGPEMANHWKQQAKAWKQLHHAHEKCHKEEWKRHAKTWKEQLTSWKHEAKDWHECSAGEWQQHAEGWKPHCEAMKAAWAEQKQAWKQHQEAKKEAWKEHKCAMKEAWKHYA